MTLVNAADAAAVLNIDPALIRVWKSRRRLTAYPLVQGRVVVSWEEIVPLARAHKARQEGLRTRSERATMSTVSGRAASPERTLPTPRRGA